ncbi:MAG: hypothetical protein AAGA84_07510 [Pseudomonadota bacterium]
MRPSDLTLTPTVALIVFVIAVWAGYRFRHVWKHGDSPAKTWAYGLIAAIGLLIVALVPMRI